MSVNNVTNVYREQRDTLVPSEQYVFVEPREGLPEGARVKIARLTLKRTLRFSKLLDRVGNRTEVLEILQNFGSIFGAEIELPENANEMTQEELAAYMEEHGETRGLVDLILNINRIIAVLEPEDIIELYSIITEADENFIDNFWDIDWGIEAIRLAFQQPGFKKLINRFTAQNNAEDSVGEQGTDDGVEGNSTTEGQASTASSTSYSDPTGSPTNTYSP